MAERLPVELARRLGRPSLYPWAEWADGSAWRIVRGEDFEIGIDSMRSALWAHATRTGMQLKTRVDGDAIEFQFTAAEPQTGAAA